MKGEGPPYANFLLRSVEFGWAEEEEELRNFFGKFRMGATHQSLSLSVSTIVDQNAPLLERVMSLESGALDRSAILT